MHATLGGVDFTGLVSRFLRVTTASIDEVSLTLWTDADASRYVGPGETYQAAILDQYKTYVEMADRVSARRGLTNTFFLTLNTLVLTTAGLLGREPLNADFWFLTAPLAGLLVQCAAWHWLLRSYRQLNSAKYIVIGALEERLPASPYWRAEWTALGKGKMPSRYWPLSHLEQWIPGSFALIYLAGFIIALVA